MDIDYGFDAAGGFFAILHGEHRAEYAYPSSYNARQAKYHPENVARKMLTTPCVSVPADIRERHYANVCQCNGR